jgi:predicted HNH restriction endonuclease
LNFREAAAAASYCLPTTTMASKRLKADAHEIASGPGNRNRELVRKKRDAVLRETGQLACEACGFDFNDTYGEHGRWFIEVYHLLPLHAFTPGTRTRLQDLAVLCANCHRMVHARPRWLTLLQLKELLAERSRVSLREMNPA